jgi:hypothetical protein
MTEEERRRMASSAVPKFPEGQMVSVRDWSQNPAVAAAMKTGNISEIEKATAAARDAFRAGGTWAEGARQVPLNPIPALQQKPEEDRQMALARASEAGFLIGQRLQDQSTQRGYAFRQGLAETEAQRALNPAFGTTVTRGGAMRGAQALAEAERWKQAQAGRAPMSREPLVFGGMGGPQPQQSMATSARTAPTTNFAPVIPQRSLGLTAESPLAFTPFGRTIGEAPFRTPEIPPAVRSPLPENIASSIRSPFGIPRFPYLRA